MTAASREPAKSRGDSIVTTDYQPGQVASITTELKALYADVYAEPPYYETESDVAKFADRLAAQLRESSFFLVAAWDENRLAGYIYGFAIDRHSSLWAKSFCLPILASGRTESTELWYSSANCSWRPSTGAGE